MYLCICVSMYINVPRYVVVGLQKNNTVETCLFFSRIISFVFQMNNYDLSPRINFFAQLWEVTCI